jgi:hypothetical protein
VDERQLGRAAADVHVKKRGALRRTPLRGGDPDETRLFEPGEDFDPEARRALHLVGELGGVLGLAHGGGGDGDEVLGAACLGALSEAADGLGGAGDGPRAQAPLPQRLVAEAHRLLLAREHGERVARGGVNHHELDRVRADIDGRKFHRF